MKKLIFGSGKVASVIKDEDTIIVSHSQCDITDYDSVVHVLKEIQPDVAINCAAKTNLEYCQMNREESYRVNTLGPINLIQAASRPRIKLLHISSGCLFDGNDFISTEETIPSPAVWYTWTKLWADQYIQNYGYENYLILRPRQLISKKPHPTNMITKFSKMSTIPAITEPNSLTCIEDFKLMINHLIDKDETGIFNCCNTGTVSPYDIAEKIKESVNPSLIIEKSSYEDLLKILPNRRVNTILSCEKLIKSGFRPRSASEALGWCIENYGS